MSEGHVLDGTVSQSEAQQKAIWHVREGISLALNQRGGQLLSRALDTPNYMGYPFRQEWHDNRHLLDCTQVLLSTLHEIQYIVFGVDLTCVVA